MFDLEPFVKLVNGWQLKLKQQRAEVAKINVKIGELVVAQVKRTGSYTSPAVEALRQTAVDAGYIRDIRQIVELNTITLNFLYLLALIDTDINIEYLFSTVMPLMQGDDFKYKTIDSRSSLAGLNTSTYSSIFVQNLMRTFVNEKDSHLVHKLPYIGVALSSMYYIVLVVEGQKAVPFDITQFREILATEYGEFPSIINTLFSKVTAALARNTWFSHDNIVGSTASARSTETVFYLFNMSQRRIEVAAASHGMRFIKTERLAPYVELRLATIFDNKKALEWLLKTVASTSDKTIKDVIQENELFVLATANGATTIVKYFLENSIPVDSKTAIFDVKDRHITYVVTPLMAVLYAHKHYGLDADSARNIVVTLLNAGANHNVRVVKHWPETRGYYGSEREIARQESIRSFDFDETGLLSTIVIERRGTHRARGAGSFADRGRGRGRDVAFFEPSHMSSGPDTRRSHDQERIQALEARVATLEAQVKRLLLAAGSAEEARKGPGLSYGHGSSH